MKHSIWFDAETMNGVTYEDCQYIAQSRGYMLENIDEPSGFKCHLYCEPNKEGYLDAFSPDGTLQCHVKKAKKGEAFLIYDGAYWRVNYDYINSLKHIVQSDIKN